MSFVFYSLDLASWNAYTLGALFFLYALVENSVAPQKKQQKSPLQQALAIGWELGYSIAIPIVLFALSGRFLDRHYGTSPLFLLIGVLISLVSTSLWLMRIAKRMLADIEKDVS